MLMKEIFFFFAKLLFKKMLPPSVIAHTRTLAHTRTHMQTNTLSRGGGEANFLGSFPAFVLEICLLPGASTC